MRHLLARYAECVFWLARYMERAENLARILDVTDTFTRGSGIETAGWLSILRLNADEQRFFATRTRADAAAVIAFYVLDQANPTSIISTVGMARENARTLRPLISTEMWTQLNMFHATLRAMKPADVTRSELSRLCGRIKEACQAHAGITDGTMFRDQSWHFYQLGRYIERADQTTRLIDIKFDQSQSAGYAAGSAADVAQWNAVLRSAAGYHAFRRVHPTGLTPETVTGFLLLNDGFPRSVHLCVRLADDMLSDLRQRYRLRGGNRVLDLLDELRAVLTTRGVDGIIESGLHEFLDQVQRMLIDATNETAYDFFGWPRG